MKVFVVVNEQTYGGVCDEPRIDAFESYEKAKVAFDKHIELQREYAKNDDWEIEEGENSFMSYEDGRYLENHSCIYLMEQEVL